MLNDEIYNSYLKYTIANWSRNGNNTASVVFAETNTTKRLTTDYSTNIDITSLYLPDNIGTTINMIYNFSHVITAFNPTNDN